MAQTNYTPISLYHSTTAAAAPTSGNLVAGELALNTVDEKLYFKNSAGTVKLLASNAASSGTVSSVAATVPSIFSISGSPITTSGTLAMTYSGTALPVANGGTSLTTLTANNVILGNGTSAPTFVAPSTNGNVLTSNGTTWASTAPATSGTVTSASVVSANGFAGTVATATTTPAITLTTSITGVLKGDGTAISAATAGTDYVTPTGTETLTNKTLTAPTIASANLTTALTLAGAAGTNGQVLTSAGSGLPSWTTPGGGFTLGTPVATTSGTSIDFTGIPAGVKQIVISFNGVSTNGTSGKLIQIGDLGGIETTGYSSASGSIIAAVCASNGSTAGFYFHSMLAAHILQGSIILTLENSSNFSWVEQGILVDRVSESVFMSAGSKSLSATLDRVRITTQNGTDTFDAGEINIAYI